MSVPAAPVLGPAGRRESSRPAPRSLAGSCAPCKRRRAKQTGAGVETRDGREEKKGVGGEIREGKKRGARAARREEREKRERGGKEGRREGRGGKKERRRG